MSQSGWWLRRAALRHIPRAATSPPRGRPGGLGVEGRGGPSIARRHRVGGRRAATGSPQAGRPVRAGPARLVTVARSRVVGGVGAMTGGGRADPHVVLAEHPRGGPGFRYRCVGGPPLHRPRSRPAGPVHPSPSARLAVGCCGELTRLGSFGSHLGSQAGRSPHGELSGFTSDFDRQPSQLRDLARVDLLHFGREAPPVHHRGAMGVGDGPAAVGGGGGGGQSPI